MLHTPTTVYDAGIRVGDCAEMPADDLLPTELSAALCTSIEESVEIGVFHAEGKSWLQTVEGFASTAKSRDIFHTKVLMVLNSDDWEQ